jgi:hypothetical protein
VAISIVDELEVIDVDECTDQAPVGATSTVDLVAERDYPKRAAEGPCQLVEVGTVELRLPGGALVGRVDPILGGPFPIGTRPGTAVGRGDAQPLELLRERCIGVGNRVLDLFGPQVPKPGGLVTSEPRGVAVRSDATPGMGGVRPSSMSSQAAGSGSLARRARGSAPVCCRWSRLVR